MSPSSLDSALNPLLPPSQWRSAAMCNKFHPVRCWFTGIYAPIRAREHVPACVVCKKVVISPRLGSVCVCVGYGLFYTSYSIWFNNLLKLALIDYVIKEIPPPHLHPQISLWNVFLNTSVFLLVDLNSDLHPWFQSMTGCAFCRCTLPFHWKLGGGGQIHHVFSLLSPLMNYGAPLSVHLFEPPVN